MSERAAGKGAPEYEFEVAEDFTASHFYYVRARTRQEALDKVLNDEYDYVTQGDLRPKRSMTVRDVRRLRRDVCAIPPAPSDPGSPRPADDAGRA